MNISTARLVIVAVAVERIFTTDPNCKLFLNQLKSARVRMWGGGGRGGESSRQRLLCVACWNGPGWNPLV